MLQSNRSSISVSRLILDLDSKILSVKDGGVAIDVDSGNIATFIVDGILVVVGIEVAGLVVAKDVLNATGILVIAWIILGRVIRPGHLYQKC